tara:strand:+ start:5552 stop:6238 length:687 start_codon:yes stop_codon:yes gene_type:complete
MGKLGEFLAKLGQQAASNAGGVAGLGLSLIQMGISAAKKRNEDRAKNMARKTSERMMADARRLAEKNVYANIQAPTDSINKQYEEIAQQNAQAISALQGADSRSLVGGIGKVNAITTDATENARNAMSEALYKNEILKLQGEEGVKQQLIDMNVGEAATAKKEERDASYKSIMYGNQVLAGLGTGVKTGLETFGEEMSAEDKLALDYDSYVLGGGVLTLDEYKKKEGI